MDCREAHLLMQPYLDGALQSDKESCLTEHLAGCSKCTRELALQEKLSYELRRLGREAAQAPPELCQTVMGRLHAERRTVFNRLPLSWRRAVAAAAAFLLLAGGSAGVTAGLKLADRGDMLGFGTPAVNSDSGTIAPDSGEFVPGKGDPANSTGASNSSGGDSNPLIAHNDQNNTGDSVNSSPLTSLTVPATGGPKVLLSSGMEIITTTLRVTSQDLAGDGARVVAQAAELGAKAQTFSEQDIDKKVLILRITVEADQAHNLISSIAGLGSNNDRQDESRDVTSLYNETLIKYYDLQARICASSDPEEQQVMQAQAVSYKQQLDTWESEAGKRIIILILEHS
ncbi:zf-HC2 domain-containing protein [Pelotomaculum propionicicum]|uniref:zf-HC2 domain-containing protein n=1 Tax=Pelotomaculum propionicicum TaxID=258475 RepID=UPI003B8023F2